MAAMRDLLARALLTCSREAITPLRDCQVVKLEERLWLIVIFDENPQHLTRTKWWETPEEQLVELVLRATYLHQCQNGGDLLIEVLTAGVDGEVLMKLTWSVPAS